MLRTITLALCCALYSGAAAAQNFTLAAEKYFDDALDLMQRYALNRDKVDWPQLRQQLKSRAFQVSSIPETYLLIQVALGSLDDHHSHFVPASALAGQTRRQAAALNAAAPGPPALPAGVGYVRIPRFSGGNDSLVRQYVAQLHAQIRQQDGPALRGWVVDLRGNTGGNMWPMLLGIGPVLGEGVAGYFDNLRGKVSEWSYREGRVYVAGQALPFAAAELRCQRPDLPVAVLTSRQTASSGEAVAVAFRGRPRTRSFGTGTRGLSTSNQTFRLADGSLLNLTTAVMADRSCRPYGQAVLPDEPVEDGDALTQAARWIQAQP
ncbi:peptidase S41 [Hymenobacter gummosus]|uniref:Peptidase S41 n=1 Tax=Hymenobacter gummosus TaxID=1776032 RepID=A0A3S0J6V7_9BACT|nr:S41 family peptidase [Hymenobacter gummosus]RTQ46248.1 peptidase S41 [Hymenobacter gummosus]